MSRGVKEVFERPERGTYWVAEEEEEIVGVILAIPEWNDWRNGTVIWIHSLYVVPEVREKGVFKELYLNLKKKVEGSEDLKGLRHNHCRRGASPGQKYLFPIRRSSRRI